MIKLISSAFADNADIPALYTCDGEDKIPPLEISGVPAGAKSLALIMDDPDATGGPPAGGWDHWLIFNISPDAKKVTDGVAGKNSWGRNDYGGPCPGTGKHHYRFKLYALDTMLNLPAGSDKKALEQAMTGHTLDQVILTGLYQRPGH